ncbi:MAG: two pore domain potassium channel family protein [Alphaproteobacteria bacterium]|nr:K+ channel TrkA-N [Hyphomonas sp.]MBR9807012.1 two pore domain potassium channel family protein [Alphaproteobacteria bacterium]|tara:strand:- start:1689 stop:2153 length:465 start_codon:yes stop_codon:yes gene_type:complete
MLFLNLAVAAVLVFVTFLIHFIGLVSLSALIRNRHVHHVNITTVAGQGAAILFIVFSLFALHSVEIWVYTFVYRLLGIFPDVGTAVYYSTSAFTTVGFGDVVIGKDWRMLGAAESMNGFLLIGWSTAFLVSITAKVRVLEARIEELEEEPGDRR